MNNYREFIMSSEDIIKCEPKDYKNRSYLSAIEAAKYLGTTVDRLHWLVKQKIISAKISTSGQMRFELNELKKFISTPHNQIDNENLPEVETIAINNTQQTIYIKNAMNMYDLTENSIHLIITSPPYFDAKMYSKEPILDDLGNIHDIDEWFEKIGLVWRECYRVLQPGRKLFINIMNLPIRLDNGKFKTLNLSGKTIDLCEEIGFVFKRDIIWQKLMRLEHILELILILWNFNK